VGGGEVRHVVVGRRGDGGWWCVDDAGRPLWLPRGALDAALRGLRVGQRLRVELDADTVVAARIP